MPSLRVWDPVSGRVASFCALVWTEGFFCPSILSCFSMGLPYWSSVVFLPLDRNEVFFGYLVCIPSGWGGVTLFRSESNVLISSEGITTVGLLGAFFLPVLGLGFLSSFGWPVGSEAGRVPHSVIFASGEDSLYPSGLRRCRSWFFFFWPCCLSPSPGGSVCFGGLFYTW